MPQKNLSAQRDVTNFLFPLLMRNEMVNFPNESLVYESLGKLKLCRTTGGQDKAIVELLDIGVALRKVGGNNSSSVPPPLPTSPLRRAEGQCRHLQCGKIREPVNGVEWSGLPFPAVPQ